MENNTYISDELLAAYLDGNTNEAETQQVIASISANPDLREALEIALAIDDNEQPAYNPLPMMAMAADSNDNICSLLCEAFVMHRRGVPFDDNELLSMARNNNWLRPGGTPLHAIGQVLAHHNIMVARKYDATVNDISKALSADNDIIVAIDKEKLYETVDKEDAPNHAAVVLAVHDDAVELFDPTLKDTNVSVSLNVFAKAWAEAQNYMVQVLQSVEDYNPQPINLDDITLTDELLELREAIAENAHDAWAKARMKEGWSYGPKRDDTNKNHPDLIPYSALPDSEKEYDRLMALDTIKLVKKLGFEIVKKSTK